MKPPKFLKKGDIMNLGIDGLGAQQQPVAPFKCSFFRKNSCLY